MEVKDELLSIAEIAVTLIGFSGLISAFRVRSAEDLAARDLSALAMIIGAGSLAMLFALVPIPLAHLGLPPAVAWRVSSASFGVCLLAAVLLFALVNRRLSAVGHPERTPVLNRTTQVLGLLGAVLLLASAIAALPHGPGLYLAVLVMLLVLCLAFVGFIVVVARGSQV